MPQPCKYNESLFTEYVAIQRGVRNSQISCTRFQIFEFFIRFQLFETRFQDFKKYLQNGIKIVWVLKVVLNIASNLELTITGS